MLASLINAQPSGDFIKKTRESILKINISFLENILPEKTSLIELEKLLGKLKNKNILPNSIIADKDFKNKTEGLEKSFKEFDREEAIS